MQPLATLTDLARYQGYLSETADALYSAQAWLESSSSVVRGHCGWHISAVTDRTVTLDSELGVHLNLPCLNVTDVSAVSINGADVLAEVVVSRDGSLYLPRRWPTGLGLVSVTYSGGYDRIPRAVVAAVCSVAARGMSTPKGGAMQSETVGPASYRLAEHKGGLTLTEEASLVPYRIATEREDDE